MKYNATLVRAGRALPKILNLKNRRKIPDYPCQLSTYYFAPLGLVYDVSHFIVGRCPYVNDNKAFSLSLYGVSHFIVGRCPYVNDNKAFSLSLYDVSHFIVGRCPYVNDNKAFSLSRRT